MPTIISVLLALLVPIAWGLFSAWAFDRLRERQEKNQNREETQ